MVTERWCSARIFLWWCFKILKVDRFNFKMLINLVLPIFKPKFLYDSGFDLTGRDSWFITRLNSLLPWTFSRQGKKSNKNINGYITVKYKYNVTKNITVKFKSCETGIWEYEYGKDHYSGTLWALNYVHFVLLFCLILSVLF